MAAIPALTPNLGLPRVDSTAHTMLWSHLNGIVDGVDGQFGRWQSYAPAWSQSDGTALHIGVGGTIEGRYRQLGKTVYASIFLQRGEGTHQGTTHWLWGLPPVTPRRWQLVNGSFAMMRNGAFYGGAVFPASSTVVGAIVGDAGRVGGTVPVSQHAIGDWYSVEIRYEAA